MQQPQKFEVHGTPPLPWWRVRMIWLVLGGPAAAVLASFASLAAALRYPDPVVTAEPAASHSEQPAVQARNHAAAPRR